MAEQEIIDQLRTQPLAINELAEKLKLNWRTAKNRLEHLRSLDLVFENEEGNKRVFYLKDKDNYFDLPLTKQQEDIVLAIFSQIRQTAQVTKTQALKILYETNKQFSLNIPVGWYLYGPICLKPLTEQSTNHNLPNNVIQFIRETTTEYAKKTNSEVEDIIYQENSLYRIKKSILQTPLGENINVQLMDFIKEVPEETKEIATDCARAIMLVGWNQETKNAFELTWNYIGMINFKHTIQEHYDYNITHYFKYLKQKKQDAQLEILNIVKQYTDTKHSQDTKYQSYLKTKQSRPHSE